MASTERTEVPLEAAFRHDRFLVTGASGFIGANLVRALLARGAQVDVLLRPTSELWRLEGVIERVRTHRGTLADCDALARAFAAAAPTVVCHLAMPRAHGERSSRLLEEAIVGAAHLLALVRESRCRLVMAGSSLEYGASDVAHREDAPLWPTTVHGIAKATVSLLCRQAALEHGTPACVLRFFHVYGPWEHPERFLPRAVRSALDGALLPLSAPGIRHDWVFVDDVVDAILRAARRELPGEWLNIGSGEEHSNEDVLACVAALTGRSLRTAPGCYPRGPADAAHRRADRSRARDVLGWTPQHDLAAGVRRTLDWLRATPGAWQAGRGGRPTIL